MSSNTLPLNPHLNGDPSKHQADSLIAAIVLFVCNVNRLGGAALRNSNARGRNFNHTSVLDVSGTVFDVSRGAVALNGNLNSESGKWSVDFHILLDQQYTLWS